jgi:hypothetical protein
MSDGYEWKMAEESQDPGRLRFEFNGARVYSLQHGNCCVASKCAAGF